MGNVAHLIQESEQDASDTNVGHATDDGSGGCHVYFINLSYSELFANQIYRPGTNPITSRPQMSTKHSLRTRKHHSSRHIRTSGNHREDQRCTVRHRWMTTLSRKFPLYGARAFSDLVIFSCRCQFPMDPPAQKIVYDSPLHDEPEEESVEQNSTVSRSPWLRNTASPSPPPTLQIPSQEVDYGSDPISPEDRGESPGADKSHNTRLHASSEEMSQRSSLDAGDDHSGSDITSPENRDWTARADEGTSAISHPSSRELSPVPPYHTDYDHSGSRTNLQDTLSSGGTSGVDVSDEGSGESSVRKLVFGVAEVGVGSDDSDEEDDLSETQQDDSEVPGMLLVPTLPARNLHGRRFSSGYRRQILPK